VPLADVSNAMPKLVASNTLTNADEWQNSTLVDGNASKELKKLKDQPGGDISITGSPTLVRSLLFDGVLDELRLLVHPLVVGPGKRLFEDATSQVPLKLVDERKLATGVLYLSYAPAG
jgi:dihydrofolate reductase